MNSPRRGGWPGRARLTFFYGGASLTGQVLAPAGAVEAAVARLQGIDLDAAGLQWRDPAAIRAQLGPAGAAQRQQTGLRGDQALAVRAGDAQGTLRAPAQPAAARVQAHPLLTQAAQPGTQQRCGFHFAGKHPATAADEGFDTQAMHPGAQRLGIEVLQPVGDPWLAAAVTLDELRLVLGMGDVQSADPGEQELASQRRHGVEQVDWHTVAGEYFGGHQAGRATADNGHAGRG